MSPSPTVVTLHKLLETCEDSRRAFASAARVLEEGSVKEKLKGLRDQREQFCTQLRNVMTMLNANPLMIQFETGSIAGTLQRAWIKIEAAITSKDEAAIIDACLIGESWSRDVYESAIDEELPEGVQKVVANQHSSVVKAQHDLKRLQVKRSATDS